MRDNIRLKPFNPMSVARRASIEIQQLKYSDAISSLYQLLKFLYVEKTNIRKRYESDKAAKSIHNEDYIAWRKIFNDTNRECNIEGIIKRSEDYCIANKSKLLNTEGGDRIKEVSAMAKLCGRFARSDDCGKLEQEVR